MKRRHTESELQRACVRWFDTTYPLSKELLVAVPNGGARSKTEAAIMKGEGVRAGFPDMMLLVPGRHGTALFIEFKAPKGIISPEQSEYHLLLHAIGGFCVVVRSEQEFREWVTDHLRLNPMPEDHFMARFPIQTTRIAAWTVAKQIKAAREEREKQAVLRKIRSMNRGPKKNGSQISPQTRPNVHGRVSGRLSGSGAADAEFGSETKGGAS